MVSTYTLQEKYNQVRRNFCFYLDVNNGISRTLSKRIADLGLQQEVFLTSKVTHVVREPTTAATSARWAPRDARSRANAMLQRIQTNSTQAENTTTHNYITLTIEKAIILLDKIYDTFFSAPHKTSLKTFQKDYIKIEFLDKPCRPIYKEFDVWPEISLEPDPPREVRRIPEKNPPPQNILPEQKMTRKSRPRIKEKEEKDPKGGYCEMCNTEYADVILHRRSPQHLTFVRDHANYISLDTLIEAGADVNTFLEKHGPINGERRSLRKLCNGDSEAKTRRSLRSQSPESTVNGHQSPRRNGTLEDERKSRRCSKRTSEISADDRQYYKVIGVSTKLRSSGGFVKKKESPPTCNGAKPLVVKFKKIRKSELSVLSNEAEQFMFPKRASSSSSDSSDDEEEDEKTLKTPPQPLPTLERRRLARPLALKEESSEEDSWPEDNRQKKKRLPPVVRRTRRFPSVPQPEINDVKPEETVKETAETTKVETVEGVNPLREEAIERCMKWEDGRLKYTPAVEQLEFVFESVPQSEPWFETFKRQDQDKIVAKNIPQYFSLYSTKSPKLPYEIGQLPPLKPNCCPLSDLVKRDDKAGPSRAYGTRGMKKQKFRKRNSIQAIIALDGHPRKSPREHASTLAILGSAGLLHRRRNGDDTKSTASEDTISETQSNTKIEPVISEMQEASERLQQFLSEVFEDASEYDVSEEAIEGDTAVTTSTTHPDVLSLMSECDRCDIIQEEIRESAATIRPKGKRGKLKKKNRTGWPIKKKVKKDSRTNSSEKGESSLDRSSAEPHDESTQESVSDAGDKPLNETDSKDVTLKEQNCEEKSNGEAPMDIDEDSDDKPLKLDVKLLLRSDEKKEKKEDKRFSRSSASESEDKEVNYKPCPKSRRRCTGSGGSKLGPWLMPVVRVARVEPRALRSARPSRLR